MLNILVYYKAKSKEDIQGFFEGAKAAKVDELSRKDKGNVMYDYYFSPDEDKQNEMLLVERWESREDQQAHLKQPVFVELGALKEKYGITTELVEI